MSTSKYELNKFIHRQSARIDELEAERDAMERRARAYEKGSAKLQEERDALAREWDALAAHVERQNSVIFDTLTADEGNLEDAPFDLARDVYNESPTTSLARLIAKKQAEALERLEKCQVTDSGVRLVVGRDLEKHLAEYRRRADPNLCVDEGCPHHGTPHVCINRQAEGDANEEI